ALGRTRARDKQGTKWLVRRHKEQICSDGPRRFGRPAHWLRVNDEFGVLVGVACGRWTTTPAVGALHRRSCTREETKRGHIEIILEIFRRLDASIESPAAERGEQT